jgi:hypothetical protein
METYGDVVCFFIAALLFKKDGQFTDALKIRLATWTVGQAHRIEDPAGLG